MEKMVNDDKIDLISIFKLLARQKRLFGINIIIAIFIGSIITFSIPKTYKTDVTLAPEINASNGLSGNLSDLASMVGVNLNSNTNGGIDAIYPELYPKIINSTPFLTSMFNVKIKINDNGIKDITLYDYISKYQKSPWWSNAIKGFFKLFKKEKTSLKEYRAINNFNLSEEQNSVANAIKGMITCNVDKKTSIISISVTAQDAVISAALADTVTNKIQQYITNYRTQKARNDLAYTQKLYTDAKAQYIKSMEKYGSYSDANFDVILTSFKAKQDEMENEMQLRYNIYNQCMQQLQLAKAKVQERTPAFTMIQPATVPLLKAGPKRMTIIIGYIFLAIVLTSIYILIQDARKKTE